MPYLVDPDREPLRRWAYSERFKPNGPGPYDEWWQAAIGERYKLIRTKGAPDELYDLSNDRHEQVDLLASGQLSEQERRAYLWLQSRMPHQY